MNNVFLYRMPVGIAGAVSRPQDLTVEPVVLKSDNAFAAYGLAGKYDDDGFFVPLADGDTADKVKGIYAPLSDHVAAGHGSPGGNRQELPGRRHEAWLRDC